MKKIMKLLLIALAVMLVASLSVTALGADFYTVTKYSERITPSEGKDGLLTVALEAEPDPEGYVYLLETVKEMAPVELAPQENVAADAQLEQVKLGSATAYRVKAADASSPVALTATFACTNFYGAKAAADETGSPSTPVSHKFTNLFDTPIGKYDITIYTPKDSEIIKVTTPAKYADFNLGLEEGLRSVSTSKSKLVAAGAVTLNLSYGHPFASKGYGKILVWVVCLAVGGAVLYARLPRKEKVKKT